MVGSIFQDIYESQERDIQNHIFRFYPKISSHVNSKVSARGKCVNYLYGGCGGTKNLFDTEQVTPKIESTPLIR